LSKVLVVSDQPVLRHGLEHVLGQRGFEISAAGARPDLILLDITAGLTMATSGALPLEYVFRTLELGVRGIVPRTAGPDLLCLTLKKVMAGEMQIGFHPTPQGAQVKKQVSLTPRERELVSRLRNGLRNKQIAAEMNITEGTVKIYLFRLFHKMGVRTRFELARHATLQAIN
jgi:DNA-binding NarL/FixJ family response regulator